MTINYDRDQLSYALANALKERDEWAAMCGRYKQERDDARRQAADAITDYTLMEAKCFRLEHHDKLKS
jgi:F0F1-type ATP synthase membrane subunit b/b'